MRIKDTTMKIPIDKVVEKIFGFGIPALVLIVMMGTTGLAGAAAFTTALAILGGPFGMFGGAALLGGGVLFSAAITHYGYEKILRLVLEMHIRRGKTKEEILRKIRGYPISPSMKEKIESEIKKVLCKNE